MKTDISDLLVLFLRSLQNTIPSSAHNEFLSKMYNLIPPQSRVDMLSRIHKELGMDAVLSLYISLSSHTPFTADMSDHTEPIPSTSMVQSASLFQAIPDILSPSTKTRACILPAIARILANNININIPLYSNIYSSLPEDYRLLPAGACTIFELHCTNIGIAPHLERMTEIILPTLNAEDVVYIFAAWYSEIRCPTSFCSVRACLKALCEGLVLRSAFLDLDYNILFNLLHFTLQAENLLACDSYCALHTVGIRDSQSISFILTVFSYILPKLNIHDMSLTETFRQLPYTIINIAANIISIGPISTIQHIRVLLMNLPLIIRIEPEFCAALVALIDSLENMNLQSAISIFQTHGLTLFRYFLNKDDTNQDTRLVSAKLALMHGFCHRAIMLARYPARRFYLQTLPILILSLRHLSLHISAVFPLQFIITSLLPTFSTISTHLFFRSRVIRKRFEEQCRTGLSPSEYTILNLNDDLHKLSTNKLLEKITSSYYFYTTYYQSLTLESPLLTDHLAARVVFHQIFIDSILGNEDIEKVLLSLCDFMDSASASHQYYVLSLTICCVTTVIEHLTSIDGYEFPIKDTLLGKEHLINRVIQSFSHLYTATRELTQPHRQFLISILFPAALHLSYTFSLMPSALMDIFFSCTFRPTISTLNSKYFALDAWTSLVERGSLSHFDVLLVVLLCVLCERNAPLLTRKSLELQHTNEQLLTFLSNVEHMVMRDLLLQMPDYVRSFVRPLQVGLLPVGIQLKASISLLEHAYRLGKLPDFMLELHTHLLDHLSTDLSPLFSSNIQSNSLQLAALGYKFKYQDGLMGLTTNDLLVLIDDWKLRSEHCSIAFLGFLTSLVSACADRICRLRMSDPLLEECANQLYHACNTVFNITTNNSDIESRAVYIQQKAEALFLENLMEALWCLHRSSSAQYLQVMALVKRFFLEVYQFITEFPLYSYSIASILMHCLHVLIFNRSDVLLRATFIKNELIDMVICLALYFSEEKSNSDVKMLSSVAVQLGRARCYQDINPVAPPSEEFFFADYRTRKLAASFLQLLTLHISPLRIIHILLTWNMELSKEALSLHEHMVQEKRFQLSFQSLHTTEQSNLYSNLFPLLLNLKKELYSSTTIKWRRLALLYIIRMLASIAYDNRSQNEDDPDVTSTTIQGLVSLCRTRIPARNWNQQFSRLLEQIVVILLTSSPHPLTVMHKVFPPLLAKRIFDDIPAHLMSYLIITCNTIRIVIDEWIAHISKQASTGIIENYLLPDNTILQMYLRGTVPFIFSPNQSIRTLAQSFFLAIHEQGQRIAEVLRTNNKLGLSLIDKALLSASISFSILEIFKLISQTTNKADLSISSLAIFNFDIYAGDLCSVSVATYMV